MHTEPEAADVDVRPAADQRGAGVHGQGQGPARVLAGRRRCRSFVRHQAAVVVSRWRGGRLRPWRRQSVRVRLTQADGLRRRLQQEVEKDEKGQKEMYRQLLLQLSPLLFGRVFRLTAL